MPKFPLDLSKFEKISATESFEPAAASLVLAAAFRAVSIQGPKTMQRVALVRYAAKPDRAAQDRKTAPGIGSS